VAESGATKGSSLLPRPADPDGEATAEFVVRRIAGLLGRLKEKDRRRLLQAAKRLGNDYNGGLKGEINSGTTGNHRSRLESGDE